MSGHLKQHFWASQKATIANAVNLPRCIVGDKEREYNFMTKTRTPPTTAWDDLIYLGQGDFAKPKLGDYSKQQPWLTT